MLNNLGDVAKAEFHNASIRIKAIVSGKSATPYKIPHKIKVRCHSFECSDDCPYKKVQEIEITATDERILMFIDVASTRIPSVVKIYLQAKCKALAIETLSTQNVLRIFISQPTGGDRTRWTASQTSYFVGHDIDTNNTYYLSGYATVDPKSQVSTYVFTKIKKAKSDVESFELTDAIKKRLNKLRHEAENVDEIYAYLGHIYESYALNVTKIYHRFLLHMAIDLVFHSSLEFMLPGSRVQSGRLDAIVVGDTRCGKGHVAEGLAKYYAIGEVVGAENCTFAGLVGGMQQIGNHWVISWGRIPLNDRGLVIIDEASELKEDDWTRLSRIRSEGVAEVTKIQQQVTNARTRLLFLSNAPSKAMSSYSFGIQCLSELVHAPEDIARFDFACIVSHEEVPIERINRAYKTTNYVHEQQAERELIMWTWSRRADQIIFTEQAVEEIYKTATRLGKFYDIGIPLIQGENVRFKLAKIAIAYAARLFSASEDCECLKVKRVHVQAAATFFRSLYTTDANGYHEHSWQQKELNPELQASNIAALVQYFNAYKEPEEAYRYLLNHNTINARDIMEHLQLMQDVAIEVLYNLIKFRCIVKKGQNYVKTAHFTKWLRERVKSSRKKAV